MGLDWVVLAEDQNGVQVNPIDVIGAKRATRDDAEVLVEMLRLWQVTDQVLTFEEFIENSISQETPPIVIEFGKGFREAIPAVQAEVQYYGYRGKVVEPRHNCISRFAEQDGYDWSWIFGELNTQAEIVGKIVELEQIIQSYRSTHLEIVEIGEEYYGAWRAQDHQIKERIELDYLDKPDDWVGIDAVYGFLGAIDWLKFWSDKGFSIAADY